MRARSSPEIRIEKSLEEIPEPAETPILGMTEPEMDAEIRRETCKVGASTAARASACRLKHRAEALLSGLRVPSCTALSTRAPCRMHVRCGHPLKALRDLRVFIPSQGSCNPSAQAFIILSLWWPT